METKIKKHSEKASVKKGFRKLDKKRNAHKGRNYGTTSRMRDAK